MKKVKLSLILIVAAFTASASNVPGQGPQIASVVHAQHKISSTVLGEERTILVRVPADYERTDTKYPVVYMLDAHPPQNAMMAGIVEQQAWGDVTPEMIIVGIQNTHRVRDMTPTKTERQGSGGAEKFLQFIETEVIPLVDKNYRTQPYRIFAGHSLAGLLVVYSLVTKPDLFNAYVAASPFLHWDNNFVIKRAEEAFGRDRDWNKRLYVALGDEPAYIDGFNAFQEQLKKSKLKNLRADFQQIKTENHGSIVLPAYHGGLRMIFDGWQPPQRGSVADLEAHYGELSRRFGYKIPVPEALINRVGYQMLRSGKAAESIEVFRKNVEAFPNSANVYDSLGEAYEQNGQLKLARDNYEKAYRLAQQRGEAQIAQAAKTNLDRVAAKLK